MTQRASVVNMRFTTYSQHRCSELRTGPCLPAGYHPRPATAPGSFSLNGRTSSTPPQQKRLSRWRATIVGPKRFDAQVSLAAPDANAVSPSARSAHIHHRTPSQPAQSHDEGDLSRPLACNHRLRVPEPSPPRRWLPLSMRSKIGWPTGPGSNPTGRLHMRKGIFRTTCWTACSWSLAKRLSRTITLHSWR